MQTKRRERRCNKCRMNRNDPHCPTCFAPLPKFSGIDLGIHSIGTKTLGVTFHVECACGTQCDIHKKVITMLVPRAVPRKSS
jgi:hypothetical protein